MSGEAARFPTGGSPAATDDESVDPLAGFRRFVAPERDVLPMATFAFGLVFGRELEAYAGR